MTVYVNSQCKIHYMYIFTLLNSQNFIQNIDLEMWLLVFPIEFTVNDRFTRNFPDMKHACTSKITPIFGEGYNFKLRGEDIWIDTL
jgi:hypothetical protein